MLALVAPFASDDQPDAGELAALHVAIRNASRVRWFYACGHRTLKLARAGQLDPVVARDAVRRYRARIRELRPLALSRFTSGFAVLQVA